MPSFIYESPQNQGKGGRPTLSRMISQQQQHDLTITTRPQSIVHIEAPRLSLIQRFKSSIINSMPIDGIPSWLSTTALMSLMGVTIALLIALIIDRFLFVSDLDASIGQFVYCVHGECAGNDGEVAMLSFLSKSKLDAARGFMVAAFITATFACITTAFWLFKSTAVRTGFVLASHVVMMFCLSINICLWASMKPSGSSYMASYDLVVLAFVGTVFSTCIWSYCEHRRRRTCDHNVVVDGHQADHGIDQGIDESVRPVRLNDTIREISRSGTSTAHVYTLDQMSEFEELEEKQAITPHHTAKWTEEKKMASAEEVVTLTSFLDDDEEDKVASPISWKPIHLTVNTGDDLTHNVEFMRHLDHSIQQLNKSAGVSSVDVLHNDDHDVIDIGPMSMDGVLIIEHNVHFDSSTQSETDSIHSHESSRISIYSAHEADCTCSPEHISIHLKVMDLGDTDTYSREMLTYEDPEMVDMIERVTVNV